MKLRFAPSPTGYLHVGNARTLILNWLFARHHGADFLIRFDDTDQERSRDQYKEQIFKDLAWLGLDYEEVAHQSQRQSLYNDVTAYLRETGRLYPCFETKNELDFKRKRQLSQGRPPIYDRAALALSEDEIEARMAQGQQPHWRFKLTDGAQIQWDDLAHGKITFESSHLSDPIVIRENGAYLFTLTGVIDDIDLGVTHVIRGDDHISNTAIQMQIIAALEGYDFKHDRKNSDFHFAHVPLMTLPSGEGLSKRLNSLSLMELQERGFESLAVLNYLSVLGNSQVAYANMTPAELVAQFDLAVYGKSAPKFFLSDLEKTNAKILHEASYAAIAPRLREIGLAEASEEFWYAMRPNLTMLEDLSALHEICSAPITPLISEGDQEFITHARAALPPKPLDDTAWQTWTQDLKQKTGRKGKRLFMPLRKALTGLDHGPEMSRFLPHIDYARIQTRLAGQKG